MGLHIRDEREMKALPGLSQAQFDSLLPVFRDLYRAAQQHTYEAGANPAHAGDVLVVAPKGNCPPW